MSDADDAGNMLAIATAFANDDDDDVAAAILAAQHHIDLLAHASDVLESNPRPGSFPGKSPNKKRDFRLGEAAHLRDYFGVDGQPPIYDETDFERRFRLPRIVFDRLYRALACEPYFQQRVNATGQPQSSTLAKLSAALRVLAYGEASDRPDEYVRLSESTINETVRRFARFVVDKFKPVYLRKPTRADLERIMKEYEEAGFPGCMGCVDCSHWQWASCPVAQHGQYQGKSGKRTIVMETVADKDLYLWHFFCGLPGAMNDLNVMAFSPLFHSMIAGTFPPPIPYTVNGVERTLPYFLCDGIYPKYPVLMGTSQGDSDKEKFFASWQEGRRKDAERVYAAYFQEWQIMARPSRFRHVETMKDIATCCAILHNMIVVHRRKEKHVPPPRTLQDLSTPAFVLSFPLSFSTTLPSQMLTFLSTSVSPRDRDLLFAFPPPLCSSCAVSYRETLGAMPSGLNCRHRWAGSWHRLGWGRSQRRRSRRGWSRQPRTCGCRRCCCRQRRWECRWRCTGWDRRPRSTGSPRATLAVCT